MADNPYTAPSISGFNSSPPPDDGSTTASNTVEWDKHKTKLADPIKTLSETDITNTTTAFGKVINTDANQNNSMAGSLAFAQSTLTIASGSVTATRRNHLIAAETGTTDDLANITTGSVSDFAEMVIRPDSGDTITVKDAATGAGEIHLANNIDYVMSGDQSLTLQRRGADWYELARDTTVGVTSLSNTSITAITNLDLKEFLPGIYDNYEVWLSNGQPANDAVDLELETSTDGGTSFDSGASDYTWAVGVFREDASANLDDGSADATEIQLNGSSSAGVGNAANEGISLRISVFNPEEAEFTSFTWSGTTRETSTFLDHIFGGGDRQSAADVDALRFHWSAGDWAAQGKIQFLGITQ